MLLFYRHVFVFITIPLIVGIVCSGYLDRMLTLVSVLALMLSIGAYFVFRKVHILHFILFFFLTGLMHDQLNQPDTPISAEGDVTFIMKVAETDNSDKEWKRGIGNITGIKTSSGVKDCNEKLLFYSTSDYIRPGEYLAIRSELVPVHNQNNPGEFDAVNFWRSKSVSRMTFFTDNDFKIVDYDEPGFFQRSLIASRDYLEGQVDKSFSPDHAGLMKAILLGNKGDLNDEIRKSFSNAGAMHVLAVSGLHVGIILLLLIGFFRLFPKYITNLNAHIISLILIWLYVAIIGFPPSVIRASFMFTMLVLSRLVPGQYRPINILFFSAFVNILINPLIINDIGFQLSYLAMLGIFLLYKPLERSLFVKNKLLLKVWQGTCVGISAQIFTAPMTLFYFHQFPNYFVITNVGIMALAGLILSTGLLFFFLHKVPGLSKLIILAISSLMFVLISFISLIDHLPGSVAYGFNLSWYHLLIVYLGIVFLLYAVHYKPSYFRMSIACILFLVVLIQWERYRSMERNELIIYNAGSPLVSVKVSGSSFTFLNLSDITDKSINKIIADYLKVSPAKNQFVPVADKMIKLKTGKAIITITPFSKYWRISVNDQIVTLITGYSKGSADREGMTVGMRYLHGEYDHLLDRGAFILPL